MYLFDASSIVNLVKRGLARVFMQGVTLDLAFYEALNAIWKEHVLLERIDEETALEYAAVIARVFQALERLDVQDYLEDVLRLAFSEGLTVYDAAYLYTAARRGLTLVTDDQVLAEKAAKYVRVLSSSELASRSELI